MADGTEGSLRLYLKVSYTDKDEVKALGAEWDANVRKWYVLQSTQKEAFTRWLPPAELNRQVSANWVANRPLEL